VASYFEPGAEFPSEATSDPPRMFFMYCKAGRWLTKSCGWSSSIVIQQADPSQECCNSPLAFTSKTEMKQGTSERLW